MATTAQITANRLNAAKSTGPRSVEGKAASSMNALKHGARAESLIIPGEDPEALAQLEADYRNQYQPVGPEEDLLVHTIVRADWNRRRMDRLEAEVFRSLAAEAETPSDTSLGDALRRDAAGPNALTKIWRRQQAATREWTRARAELRRIQEERTVLAARHQLAAKRANEPNPPARHAQPAGAFPNQPIPPSPGAPVPVRPNEPNFTSKTGTAATPAPAQDRAVALYNLLRSENLL